MRKYNELNTLTKNGHLAKFAKYKKNHNYSNYLLLDDFLNSYGIGLFGSYKVHENFSVHGLNINSKKFYPENWKIVEEFYGWTNLKVDIGLMGFTESSENSICFIELDTEKDFLVLKELSFGATIIIPIITWFIIEGELGYFNIKDYLKEFRNYKIKE